MVSMIHGFRVGQNLNRPTSKANERTVNQQKTPILSTEAALYKIAKQFWWTRKKSKNTIFCHSGESRNPVISVCSGCRIRSGMTNWDFLRDRQFYIGTFFACMCMQLLKHKNTWIHKPTEQPRKSKYSPYGSRDLYWYSTTPRSFLQQEEKLNAIFNCFQKNHHLSWHIAFR